MTLEKFWNPERFQGDLTRQGYFEGWYFKLTAPDGRVLALIPGVVTGEDGHAFLQVADSMGESRYLKFPLSDFYASPSRLWFRMGENIFSEQYIKVKIREEGFRLSGTVRFCRRTPYPKRGLHRGIMGPFGLIPGLECYHGVVNLDGVSQGGLWKDGTFWDFSGGRCYVEKDWGTSFPKRWVWMQGHFEKNVSFVAAVADVPVLGTALPGVIAVLTIAGECFPIATYWGGYCDRLHTGPGWVEFTLCGPRTMFRVQAKLPQGASLAAPAAGKMDRTIQETLQGEISLTAARDGQLLYRGRAKNAGVEVSL